MQDTKRNTKKKPYRYTYLRISSKLKTHLKSKAESEERTIRAVAERLIRKGLRVEGDDAEV